MRFQFTPAAERALAVAAGWTSCDDHAALRLPEVLLGLVHEAECRAARMLAEHGVDLLAVRARWNALTPLDSPVTGRDQTFSPSLEEALGTAEALLWDYSRPLLIATEHLLLGILASKNDVANWLQSQGMNAELFEAEIHRLAGHERGPLMMPEEEESGVRDQGSEVSSEGAVVGHFAIPSSELSVVRILDAAANRASEGLRVVEDYVRFALDDRYLTGQIKTLRHELAVILSGLVANDRLAARESLADVGVETKTTTELTRQDIGCVVTASFQRLQQALRSLEEFAKLSDHQCALRLEQLRYRAYTLERALDITRSSLDRLVDIQLYVLLDARSNLDDFRQMAETLVAAGTHVVQLRDKSHNDRILLERAKNLRDITRGTPTLFIMNDRPDLTLLADADGVHVGQEELTVKDARTIVGPRRLVGASTHSIEQARQAVLDGANYIGVGPTFPSGTKPFSHFPSLDLVRAVASEIRLPAFAIGGISLGNLDQVMAAGATRVAVSAAVVQASDPGAAVAEFVSRLSVSKR